MRTKDPVPRTTRTARSWPGLVASVLLATAIGLSHDGAALADETSTAPSIAFERYTLDNGLEVILHQDNSVPLVAVNVWYHVGAGNEVPGRSGFAHLFEHMLFQGSKHVGEDRHFEILKNIGGSQVNGSTNTDRTNYYQVVPSHQLETALWLESDRMGYVLPMVTQKSLDNQIEVVRNERRQRVDNVPYGTTLTTLSQSLHPEGHPYKYTVIGRHEDLAAATLDDVRNFYKTWYVPANATLVLAGDFDRDAAKALVQKWFGSFPQSTKPAGRTLPMPRISSTSTTVEDNFAKLRMLTYAWHTPAMMQPGDAELDILADALGAEGTGRLYRILVHQKQLAQQVSVFQYSRQLSSAFIVQITLHSGASLDEVKRIVDQEIEAVRTKNIEQRELARAIAAIESRFVWGLESLLGRAESLQRYNHYVGNPDYVRQDLERYTKATLENVRTQAAEFLAPERRVEILTVPAQQGAQ